ncbi:MAG: hypothetical protein ACRCTJ_01515 [Brevinema sp.]
MKHMNKFLLIATMTLGVQVFADDIYFLSPQPGQPINGPMTIQIHQPFHKTDVNVWIKREDGMKQVVWRGKLRADQQYAVTVDTSKFKPGRYEIKAEYYIGMEDYDGDIEIWIGSVNIPAGGEYYPQ